MYTCINTACVNWCDSRRCDPAGTGKFETHCFSELSSITLKNVCILITNMYIYEMVGFNLILKGFNE